MLRQVARAAHLAAVGAVFGWAGQARAVEPPLASVVVASGITRPTRVTYAPGDYARVFITEQTGKIKILKNGSILPTPFLDVQSLMGGSEAYLEYGLIGLCFHPNYATNGYFYVCYTVGTTALADPVVARYQVSAGNPDVANPASGVVLSRITYSSTSVKQHRSAWMAFGPDDGYLYYNTGDGGEGDPQNAASNLASLHGKILRLDVNGPDGVPGTADDDGFPTDANKLYRIPANNPFVSSPGVMPEIWAYGLRNPWSASFDRLTHDLYIADVGQIQREEIDFQPAGFAGGANYGWRCKEGFLTSTFAECGGTLPVSVPPILDYPRTNPGGLAGGSVLGGSVYRGCAIPELGGTYFFGDWSTQKIWTFRYTVGGGVTALTDRTAALGSGGTSLLGFGEDAYGEIYFMRNNGEIRKIVPATAQGPDCNGNGRRDACDIASGVSADVNANGVPDECECVTCPGDTTGNGMTDGADIQRFVSCCVAGTLAGPGCRCANMNGDGAVSGADVSLFVDKVIGAGDPDPACP